MWYAPPYLVLITEGAQQVWVLRPEISRTRGRDFMEHMSAYLAIKIYCK